MSHNSLITLGAIVLLALIFGVPAVLVPNVMDDVPARSMTKVLNVHQEAANIIGRTFAKHRDDDHPGRLMPLPGNTNEWIELINPLGRKAPGGGPAILPQANGETGAVGLTGDVHHVKLTIPAYRELERRETIFLAKETADD